MLPSDDDCRSGTAGAHRLRRPFVHQASKDLNAYLARGGGFVVIHAATYMHVNMASPVWKPLLDLTGLAFQLHHHTEADVVDWLPPFIVHAG